MNNNTKNNALNQPLTCCNAHLVSFYDRKLTALTYNDKPYVAMKPICENIGLVTFDFQKYKRYIGIGAETTSTSGIPQPILAVFLYLDFMIGWRTVYKIPKGKTVGCLVAGFKHPIALMKLGFIKIQQEV